jgi:CBS domain-containing protein
MERLARDGRAEITPQRKAGSFSALWHAEPFCTLTERFSRRLLFLCTAQRSIFEHGTQFVQRPHSGPCSSMLSKAKEIMSTPVISVRPDATIDEVLRLLLHHRVSGLPVLDEQQHLVGMVSELDLLRLLYNRMHLGTSHITDFQTNTVVTVNEEDSVIDIAEIFLSQPIRRVPVMRGEQVVGIISRRDVIRYIRDVRATVNRDWGWMNRDAQTTT